MLNMKDFRNPHLESLVVRLSRMGKWEMGNIGIKYRMSNHWHYIYTPRDLPDLTSNHLKDFTQYSASAEIGKGGRHWHVYIISDYDEKHIRDKLKLILKIPSGLKGKKSLYYSMRPVLLSNPEHPGEDLQKFTLGYTLKNQKLPDFREDDHHHKGYDMPTLEEAKKYYEETTNKRYKPPQALPQNTYVNDEKNENVEKTPKIMDDWLEYSIYINKTIKDRHMTRITYTDVKSLSRVWWARRNNGLFPIASTYTRFLASIIYELRHRLTQTEDEALEKTQY
jgi:hypothetical protein